ncbi:hypothetical protein [Aquimarina hainanensis]|uniref:hypothetical protein n=1 Tax=Aquimarina hainanensis TaxID=1578017 RepID=UPI0036063AE8
MRRNHLPKSTYCQKRISINQFPGFPFLKKAVHYYVYKFYTLITKLQQSSPHKRIHFRKKRIHFGGMFLCVRELTVLKLLLRVA